MRVTFLAAMTLVCVIASSNAYAQGVVPTFGAGSMWHVSPIQATDVSARKKKVRKAYRVSTQRIDCDDHGCFAAGVARPDGIGRTTVAVGRAVYAGGYDLVSRARAHLGKTAHDLRLPARLWCADFMNKITGGGTGSRLAASYASAGRPASPGCIGCVAVMTRGKRGGHVGVVSGYDTRGNPIIISGNHNRRVAEAVYPRGRIYAWRHL